MTEITSRKNLRNQTISIYQSEQKDLSGSQGKWHLLAYECQLLLKQIVKIGQICNGGGFFNKVMLVR